MREIKYIVPDGCMLMNKSPTLMFLRKREREREGGGGGRRITDKFFDINGAVNFGHFCAS